MKRLFVALLLAAVSMGAGQPIPGHQAGKVQVLILTGYNMHDWRTMTTALREMLERTGKFEVRVNEEPQGCDDATFEGYDLIVLNYSNYLLRFGPAWAETTRRALLRFVGSGKGLVAYHGSLSSFAEWPEYEKMIGGAWREGSTHAPYRAFELKIVDRDNPITRGMAPAYPQSDEVTQRLRMQKDIHVLAAAWDDPANCTAGSPKICGSGKEEPMAWTTRYGEGRVFTTALGHDLKSVGSAGFRTLFVRGAEWAATGSVTLGPLPGAE